jgi:hypothetical protein
MCQQKICREIRQSAEWPWQCGRLPRAQTMGKLAALHITASPMHQLLTRIALFIYRLRRRIETVLADTFTFHTNTSPSSAAPDKRIRPQAVIRLKEEMMRVLRDCPEEIRFDMSMQISSESSPAGLWFMRAQLYQYVFHAHGQVEAQRRINNLLVYFRGVVPSRMLVPI